MVDKRNLPLSEKKKSDTLIGRALLRYCLEKYFNIKKYSLFYGENGKPYLKDIPVYFNISHSGNYVVCAFSENEVGCDVEKSGEYKKRVAERFFTENEAKALEKAKNQNEAFILLWTLKESILKKDGKGITGGLNSCDFSENLDGKGFYKYESFFSVFLLENAVLAVCSNKKEKLNMVTAEEILRYIKTQENEIERR